MYGVAPRPLTSSATSPPAAVPRTVDRRGSPRPCPVRRRRPAPAARGGCPARRGPPCRSPSLAARSRTSAGRRPAPRTGQGDAHAAAGRVRRRRRRRTTSSRLSPRSAAAPAHLEHEDVAGDAASRSRSVGRRRGHVVADADSWPSDALGRGRLRREVEVQHVAGVVAVGQQDAPAGRRRADGRQDRRPATAPRRRCRGPPRRPGPRPRSRRKRAHGRNRRRSPGRPSPRPGTAAPRPAARPGAPRRRGPRRNPRASRRRRRTDR